MSTWATVFLGIIAMATLVTAILQVVLLVAAAQLVRRVGKFVDLIEEDVRPIITSVSSIARDASRVASLAAAQVDLDFDTALVRRKIDGRSENSVFGVRTSVHFRTAEMGNECGFLGRIEPEYTAGKNLHAADASIHAGKIEP